VNEEHLTVAVKFPQNGVADQCLVVKTDCRLDGKTLFRWRIDGAEVTHTGQAHVQSTGNGRCREREHIHLLPQLFDALLMANAKALFLVYDQQAQVFEVHIF